MNPTAADLRQCFRIFSFLLQRSAKMWLFQAKLMSRAPLKRLKTPAFQEASKRNKHSPAARIRRKRNHAFGRRGAKGSDCKSFLQALPLCYHGRALCKFRPDCGIQIKPCNAKGGKNKTVVFISHRLSTTVGADKIYVMENGEIAESGTHAELMEAGGKYAYMFNLQAKKYRA